LTINESKPIPVEHHLLILGAIDQTPKVTQVDLAAKLGVAVGTMYWYIKRLIAKSYLKICRIECGRLSYLVTPLGIADQSQLGMHYR
jgi:DNA-binding MarR family transcriptional regulator